MGVAIQIEFIEAELIRHLSRHRLYWQLMFGNRSRGIPGTIGGPVAALPLTPYTFLDLDVDHLTRSAVNFVNNLTAKQAGV